MIDNKKKSVVVFNCSTNVVGGGIQNSVNFIKQVLNHDFGMAWFFILSPQVHEQVKELVKEGCFHVAQKSPASSLSSRKKIRTIVENISPLLVYTSAGPAYISFPCHHIMGCSNPYILGASDYAYHLYGGMFEQLNRRLKTVYQRMYIKKADAWIVQTEASEALMRKIVGTDAKLHIIYNSVSVDFLEYLEIVNGEAKIASAPDAPKRILVPTSYYKHKDLEKIPQAIHLLKQKHNVSVEVVFTIQYQADFEKIHAIAKEYGIDRLFNNIGAYAHRDALNIYKQYDLVLQPSALEVFSTSYIESMATLKPLVVPKFDFSESICGDYAHYYDSEDMNSYADALFSAINDHEYENRYNKALSIVSKYGSQESRVNKIVSLIENYIA